MSLIWSYLRRSKKILLGAMSLATVNQFFSLLDPQIFRLLVDRYASRFTELTQDEFIRGVLLLLLALVGVALMSRIAKNFQDYLVNKLTERMGTKLYADSVEHSLSLPYAVFEDQRSGELLQQMTKARTDAQTLVKSMINVFFLSLIGVLFVLAYAFWVHWLIGAVYSLMVPVLVVATYVFSRRIKQAQRQIVRQTAGLAGSTTETIRNMELVKSLGLERQEIKRLNSVNERILGLELKKIVLVRKLSFFQGTLINALRSLLIGVMLWLIFQGQVTLGEFLSLFIYSFFIFGPLAELSTIATQYQEAKASSEELQRVLSLPREAQPVAPRSVGPIQRINFMNVSFTYGSAQTPSVRDISLEINAGETVAFVGPSGAGKSTLVKLLLGLYKPTHGQLQWNGIDVRELDYGEVRQRIGLVAQDTQLFAGTIRENLHFVRPHATDEECWRALRSAAAVSLTARGQRGLDTRIGEGGLKLSGGERQRLAIARALLREPGVIIFDEATSSLDSLTERAITETIQGIERSMPNLITVLVAHRLSTIAHADRIYVLQRGAVVEQGTHQELIARTGLYAALWREQAASRETMLTTEGGERIR